MSGIVGIYYLDGRQVERSEIQGMLNAISHRGPDGSGIWTDGSIGLGHQMLHTTPESLHEKLPLTNKAGTLAITADARIDNRDELFPSLDFNGRPRETIPDSEVILAAYEKWGERCPEKLLGDFAFAIWDKKNQRLFCARDPIGIKPFFYFFDGKTFRWASEPKPIYEESAIAKEPNLNLVCLYLLDHFEEREETLYKNIYRSPSSHFIALEDGSLRRGQYWDIDPNHTIRYKTGEEYAEHFLELFKEAVRVRLRSHGPVGATLSGGLDSSSIVCTAQLLYNEKAVSENGFETFSIVFDQLPCDERNYINDAIRKWNICSNNFIYENNLDSVDFEQTSKYVDVAYLPTLFFFAPMYRNAQQMAIRIMLNGIGGDDLLAADYDHPTDLMLKGNLLGQLRHDAISSSCSNKFLFFNYCLRQFVPQFVKLTLRRLLTPFSRNGFPRGVDKEFLRKIMPRRSSGTAVSKARFASRSSQRIYEGLFHGWQVNVALEMIERFSSLFGIESRSPFFDRNLVQFLIALPEEQRWSAEGRKLVLRNAMRDILPESIRLRNDKAEFSCAIDLELKQRQVHKTEALIRQPSLGNLGIIDSHELQQLFQEYRKGEKVGSIRNTLATFVWLELWSKSLLE